jgi:hypothetical protein
MIGIGPNSNFGSVKRILYILILAGLNLTAFGGNSDKEKATTKVISGRITNSYGESVPGAKISIPETGEVFFSDLDGNFKLSLKTDKDYSISINTIGYEPLKLNSVHLSAFSDLSLKSL